MELTAFSTAVPNYSAARSHYREINNAPQSRPKILALLLVTTALNAAILLVDFSASSRAAVANMDYGALVKDPDFKKAVQSIVVACNVNMNIARIRC
jgi:hypothetical protein